MTDLYEIILEIEPAEKSILEFLNRLKSFLKTELFHAHIDKYSIAVKRETQEIYYLLDASDYEEEKENEP